MPQNLAFLDPEDPDRQFWLSLAAETKENESASPAYASKLAIVTRIAQEVDSLFEEHGVDVLMFLFGGREVTLAACGGFPMVTAIDYQREAES